MPSKRLYFGILTLALLALPSLAGAQGKGRIVGRVTHPDGTPLAAVTVAVQGFALAEVTDRNGEYTIDGVPAGKRTVTFTLGDNNDQEPDVEITAGVTARVNRSLDWNAAFIETITVYSASRRTERVVDAPASVTIITAEEVERQAASGQLPKLLEFTPGAELTQSGMYDFNFNTRGFNSSLNRRVATLIDGRDPAVPFLGSQEWAGISFPLDDLANVELVRGPSAALYGANASSGVLNLTTKRPRDSRGGQLRLTAGELDTTNAEFRWAGGLGGAWYLKAQAGIHSTGDFAVSRHGAAEYTVPCSAAQGITTDCLPQEAVPLARENDDDVRYGSLRIDRYVGEGGLLTLEGGRADIKGPVFQTGIGRVQVLDAERPWARFNYASNHWNFLAGYTQRKAPEQLALSSGTNLSLDTHNTQFELQGHLDFAGGDARLVGGVSYRDESIDSRDPKTGLPDPALRARRLPPRGGLRPARLGADQPPQAGRRRPLRRQHAARRAVLAQGFAGLLRQPQQHLPPHLQRGVPGPQLLGVLPPGQRRPAGRPARAQPGGLPVAWLHLRPRRVTRVLALGNKDLKLETGQDLGAGLQRHSRRQGVPVARLLQEQERQLHHRSAAPARHRARPDQPQLRPLAGAGRGVPAAIEQVIRGLRAVFILSNNLDGTPILAAASYTNFGKVDTQGIELGVNYYFTPAWSGSFSYSWFDFDVKDAAPGLKDLLLPNSPENQFAVGGSYVTKKWDGGVNYRWVDTFRWVVGPFQGDVESYSTVDLTANYRFNDHWGVGANVANLFDDQHWEAFGGDLIGRRALGHVTFAW